MSHNYQQRICLYCNNAFTPKRVDQSRCSTKCSIEYFKKVKRENNKVKFESNKLMCKCCECPFVQTTSYQLFCSRTCHIDYHRQQAMIKRTADRSLVIKTCPICDTTFSPKRSMREKYCSSRCRCLFPKKIYKALQTCYYSGIPKRESSQKVLGYTPEQLRQHIQSHPNWESVKDGDWHLDHVFPIIAFLEHGIKDLKLICALENLQPLSGKANCSKNRRYDEKFFLEWLAKMKTRCPT